MKELDRLEDLFWMDKENVTTGQSRGIDDQ